MDFIKDVMTDAQNLILFITLIVGFLSILLTTVTLIWQRRHDRLQLLPILNIKARNIGDELSLTFENNGVGPLVIKSVKCKVDNGKDSQYWVDWCPGYDIIQKNEKIVMIHHELSENSVIPQQNSVRLFYCKIDPLNRDHRIQMNNIRSDLRKIKEFQIEYTDIYNIYKNTWIYRIIKRSPWKINTYEFSEDTWADIDPNDERHFSQLITLN